MEYGAAVHILLRNSEVAGVPAVLRLLLHPYELMIRTPSRTTGSPKPFQSILESNGQLGLSRYTENTGIDWRTWNIDQGVFWVVATRFEYADSHIRILTQPTATTRTPVDEPKDSPRVAQSARSASSPSRDDQTSCATADDEVVESALNSDEFFGSRERRRSHSSKISRSQQVQCISSWRQGALETRGNGTI